MFWFTRKPSTGSHSQYLAKITHLVQSGFVQLVQDVISVMAAYYDLWGVCAVHTHLTLELNTVYFMSVDKSVYFNTLNVAFSTLFSN